MIKYDPNELLKKIAPKSKIKKMLSRTLSLKRTALSFISAIDFLDKGSVASVALKTIRGYQKRVDEDPEAEKEIAADPKQLIQRVQNEVITQISSEIRDKYAGEFYIWLPSSAKEPDPEHQLHYGKKFQVGDGEQPGDRFGCRCGMQILATGSSLDL